MSIDIQSSPATVWSLIREPDNALLTTPDLAEAHRDETTPVGIGERHLYVLEFAGRRFATSWEITDLTEGRWLEVRSESGLTQSFELEYSEPLGTTVTMTTAGPVSLRTPGLKAPGAVLTGAAVTYLSQLRRVAQSGVFDGGRPRAELSQTRSRPPTLLGQSSRGVDWWWKTAVLLATLFAALTLMMLAIMFGVTALGRSGHSLGHQEIKAILVLAPLFGALIAPAMLISGFSMGLKGSPQLLTRQPRGAEPQRSARTQTSASRRTDPEENTLGRRDSWS